ncbi:MAG TPA: hypothetical protein VNO32_38935 [Candidatus Acidoferrum sp.]|nr:hypothetical protein [Candidatus Acidoferrum sp.]
MPDSLTSSAFIATNPEALLPHSLASTPPLGANLLTRTASDEVPGSGDQSLGAWTANMFSNRLLPTVERKIKEATVPFGWKKGHHHLMVDRTSRFLESTTLL